MPGFTIWYDVAFQPYRRTRPRTCPSTGSVAHADRLDMREKLCRLRSAGSGESPVSTSEIFPDYVSARIVLRVVREHPCLRRESRLSLIPPPRLLPMRIRFFGVALVALPLAAARLVAQQAGSE